MHDLENCGGGNSACDGDKKQETSCLTAGNRSPSLGAYVPELWAFRQKDSPTCREFLEDIAVLDVKEKRVLAFRGRRFVKPLPKEIWSPCGTRQFLPEKVGTFLLFPIDLSDARQLLAIFLPWPPGAVSATLRFLERSDFAGVTKPTKDDDRLFSLLSELLYYLDRIFLDLKSLPLWTVALRAANFAGCKLKKIGLSSSVIPVAGEEIPLLFSFLLCFFLSVRDWGKQAEVDLESSSPCYRVRFGALSYDERPVELPQAPFLDCEAFRRFSLETTEDGRRLLLSLRKTGKGEVSSGRHDRYLKIFLECFSQGESEE